MKLNNMKNYLVLILVVLIGFAVQPVISAPITVSTVRYSASPERSRMVFDVTGPVKYKLFKLDSPPRLVIDILNAQTVKPLPQPASNNNLIHQVRMGAHDQTGVRIVADLTRASAVKSFQLEPNKQYGQRLVIDIYSTQLAAKKPIRKSIVLSRKNKQAKSRRSSIVKNTGARKVSKSIRLPIREQIFKQPDIVIAIDAGHGGKDPGAIGIHKTKEKDVVLAISKKLANFVDASPGMKSFMIRSDDEFVPLRERMKKARSAKADMFVSIHADALDNRNIKGATVYTLSSGGALREARVWAKRKNQTELVSGISLHDKDTVLASVLLDLSQSATLEASDTVAGYIFSYLKNNGPVLRKKVQKKSYMVLKSPDIPSVLVETAFISNPDEERNLRSPAFQTRTARSIFSGLRDYFASRRLPVIQAVERSHKIMRGETLSGIAHQYGVSVQVIREINNLSGSRIKAGQVLTIAPEV
ncbi:MAG: N-acetylmuramoyl-L-alanine amidase [Methylococcales bacterium]